MRIVRPRENRKNNTIAAVVAMAGCSLSLCFVSAASAAYPTSMGALGDSITQAAMTCFSTTSCPQNSWATGTNSSVNSIALRLRGINSKATSANYAVSGAKVAGLSSQADSVIKLNPRLTTIMVGTNDACQSTSTSAFEVSFQGLIDKLRNGTPNSKLVVVSIPNLYSLYTTFKNNSSAKSSWNFLKLCAGMTSAPDEATRQATLAREIAMNQSMATICNAYANCIWDGNRVFNYTYKTTEIGTSDYFHPNVAGQAALAKLIWPLVPSTL